MTFQLLGCGAFLLAFGALAFWAGFTFADQSSSVGEFEHRRQVAKLRDALRWCGGSSDFAPGGKAHEGWTKIVLPLLKDEEERPE